MKKNISRLFCFAIFGIFSFCFIGIVSLFLWINFKPQPKPTQRQLFDGIEYIRDVRNSPRNLVIHIVKIDLRVNGIRVFVTPGNPDNALPLNARTTSEFVHDFGLQVAINGDGFTPWHTNSLFDYYPHTGDPIEPIGLAASDGVIYSADTDNEPTLYISASNRARINSQIGGIYNAISGNQTLIRNGKSISTIESNHPDPRTAIALDRANRYLILLVVDGRQPGYSEGVTLSELAEILIYHGGYNAINLDGGGSSTMVFENTLGISEVINSPINHNIPGRQRSVGNHLGIFAKPIKE